MIDPQPSAPEPRTGAEARDYLLKRAEDHRNLADATAEPGARALHLRFQQLYREKAAQIALVVPD